MRNRVSMTLPLAMAVLLIAAGAAVSQEFSLSSPAEVEGVEAGGTVTVALEVSGLTEEVMGVMWFVTFEPAAAFDLPATEGGFSAPDGFALSLPGLTEGNTMELGAASVGSGVSGSGGLGSLDVVMAADYDESEATVTIDSVTIAANAVEVPETPSTVVALATTINAPSAVPAPTVASIVPESSSVTGGITATISGSDFVDGAGVTIGATAATDIAVVDDATITCTVPAGAEGAADVVVTNPDGQEGTLAGGFTYLAVVEPLMSASTATDFTRDFSEVGFGSVLDASAGEVTAGIEFTGASGGAEAGQEVVFSVVNNGAEMVYVVEPEAREVAAGTTVTVTVSTDSSGEASVTVDAEGAKDAGSTSAGITASTSAANSDGEMRNLSVEFSAAWDVPVVAELATFAGSVTPEDTVVLEWSVVSQTGNLGWEVFRSTDNESFEQVGEFVPGAGTSDEYMTYRFRDGDAPDAEVLYYYVNQVDIDGSSARSPVIEIVVAEAQVVPSSTALLQNFPNPFNPETTIGFDVAEEQTVTLRVYDLTGQLVRTLVAGETYGAGRYESVWDGRSDSGARVASGVYVYRLTTEDFTSMKKMTLLR